MNNKHSFEAIKLNQIFFHILVENMFLKSGQVDSTFAWDTRSNLTAAQVSNPPLPALCCLHEGCPEGEPAVYRLEQCTPILKSGY